MINGIGVDIVSLNRLKDNLDSIANKVLSLKEKEIYATLISERRKLEFVAGRFAFKEALFKALKKEIDFSKISLLVNEDGSHTLKIIRFMYRYLMMVIMLSLL